jgi:hypothetical protein
MKDLRKAYSLMMMAAMFEGINGQGYDSGKSNITPEKIDVTPKQKPIPKGCSKYQFTHEGEQFFCIAINQKSAERKFNNWVKNK